MTRRNIRDFVDEGDADLENEEYYDRDGQRITPAYVESASDALERGDVEIDETRIIYHRRRRGRPSLSESTDAGGHSPTIQARVSDATRKRLSEVAKQQHRGTSDVVREALEDYLARH